MAKQKQGVAPFILFTAAIFICSLCGLTRALSGGLSVRDNSNGTSTSSWCVAKTGVPDSQLSVALNWVCAQPGIDCSPTQPNGPCFNPNTYFSHASYAFNLYYQKSGHANDSCDFGGAATIVQTPPNNGNCTYSGGSASNQTSGPLSPGGGVPNGPFSAGNAPVGSFYNSTFSKAEIPLSERFGLVTLVAFFMNLILLLGKAL